MHQADGEAVSEECWRAAIPVQLRLAENELSSLEQPPVLYLLVPRQGYLHSLVPQALQALQHLLPPGEHTPWFEHGRLPLKWGVPAGVLYDLVAAPSGELPWRLTIHFRGFPDRMLPSYAGEAALRGAFFNSLKEAACICRGSAQRVMEMAAGAQEDLWRQAAGSRLQAYRQVMDSLQLAPVALRGGRRPAVPLRLYVRRDAGGYLSSYEDIAATSRPVEAAAAGGGAVSLRDALLPLLAECLLAAGAAPPPSPRKALSPASSGPVATTGSSVQEDAGGGGEAAASADAEPPAALAEQEAGTAEVGQLQQGLADAAHSALQALEAGGPAASASAWLDAAAAERRVLVAGATPPLDAPLAWMHAQLHAPDYFLYVVVHTGGR